MLYYISLIGEHSHSLLSNGQLTFVLTSVNSHLTLRYDLDNKDDEGHMTTDLMTNLIF